MSVFANRILIWATYDSLETFFVVNHRSKWSVAWVPNNAVARGVREQLADDRIFHVQQLRICDIRRVLTYDQRISQGRVRAGSATGLFY